MSFLVDILLQSLEIIYEQYENLFILMNKKHYEAFLCIMDMILLEMVKGAVIAVLPRDTTLPCQKDSIFL